MNQERLNEILEHMRSNIISEHKAAADEYIREGFPTAILFKEAEQTRQPNLVSMYFYVSGKRSDNETLDAWHYLQKRFLATPQEFISNYDPFCLSDENRYLLFSARKYLIKASKIPIFFDHLVEAEKEVEQSIKARPESIMASSDKERCGYTISEKEWDDRIRALDQYAAYQAMFEGHIYPEIAYYKWLIYFFVRTSRRDFNDVLGGGPNRERLKQALKESFSILRNYEEVSSNNCIIDSSEISAMLDRLYWSTRESYNRLNCGNSLSILKRVLLNCGDQRFCINILDRVEDVVDKCIEGHRDSFIAALVSLNMYFYFEQRVYRIEYSLEFSEEMLRLLKITEIRRYYDPIFLPYIEENQFESTECKKQECAYMALDVLLPSGNIKAYTIVRNYLLKQEGKINRHSYWTTRLHEFYDSLYASNYAKKHVFSIGLLWEQLCQDICKQYYRDVLTNHDGVRFENNSIPDIIVGEVEQNHAGIIFQAEKVVECKKSLYFAISPKLQDETIEKYLGYCKTLEYWILEKPASYESPRNSKVKYIFAEDLLESLWLDAERKGQIQTLIEDNKNGVQSAPTPEAVKEESIFTLIDRIDTLIENTEVTFSEQMTQTTYKSDSVIRQYDLNGVFIKEYSSVFAASRAVGLKVDAITVVTSGRRNSAGGFLWKKCPIGSSIENIEPPNTALNLEGKTIFQVDQYGEVIATYETIHQAVRMTGISRRSISDALKGIQKTAGGFAWMLGDKNLQQ